MPPHFPISSNSIPSAEVPHPVPARASLLASETAHHAARGNPFPAEQLASRDAEIEHLKLLIAKLRRTGIRPVVGEEGKSDRTTGTAAGRAGGEAQKRKNCNSRINGKHYRGAPCAAALTRSLTKGSAKVSSEARSLSGLWREAKASWSGYFGDPGVRASQSQSHPIRSSQAGLCRLRSDRAGGSPEPANRARDGGSWAFGACAEPRNTATTYRCIVSRRSLRVPVWSWIVPPWQSG